MPRFPTGFYLVCFQCIDIILDITVSLRNRTGEELKEDDKLLCHKRHNNFVRKTFSAELHPPLIRSFCKTPEDINLSEDHDKTHN